LTLITTHPTRPFDIVETEQRSQDWFDARLGRVTGSKAGAIWNKTAKGLRTAEWKKYQDQLLAELLTGMSADDVFTSYEMQRGIDLEPVARRAAAKMLGLQIRETGFLAHRELMAGSSLDGDINDFAAVVEIKCPRTTTHLQYIEEKGLPEQYMGQLLHNLYVSKADSIYFVSFDDRMPPHLQLCIVKRDAKDLPLEEYERDLLEFLAQLKERKAALSTGEYLPVF
jgi:putative phage-type endonuclease